MVDELEQIRKLELLLLDPKIRQSATDLDDLLCDEFIEIGQSGKIYDKADIIASLSDDPDTKAEFSNFDINYLAGNLILAKYMSRNITVVQRHSLWEKRDDTWRMLYHETET